jgi:hypothetical protein
MGLQAARGDEKRLRRIMALLVAFAALAERAADRSGVVRGLVLWILRRAETVAAAFVLEATGAPPPAIAGTAAGPSDAHALAARFMALAAALGALLPLARRLDVPPAPRTVDLRPLRPGSIGSAKARERPT